MRVTAPRARRLDVKKRKRHSENEIIKKLRDAEAKLARGASLPAVLRDLEVSEQTYYRWKRLYAGMQEPGARRLRELEKENSRLKKLVADLTLDMDLLKEVARGKF